MKYSDAHGHFHTFDQEAPLPIGCQRAISCGTHPGDWLDVLHLSKSDARIIPALGLHPWHLQEAPPNYLDLLKKLLQENPQAHIGEIGLDRTKRSPSLDQQEIALRSQLAIALEFRRPVTLHCVRAWGRLLQVLDDTLPPHWPVLLHDFRAPDEMIPRFLKREGTLISLRTIPSLETLQKIPTHRIVYESDAHFSPASSKDPKGALEAILTMAELAHSPPATISHRADAALDRFLRPSPAP